MHVSLATSAGRADRPNEDFVGAVPGAVVLLDGAGIPEAGSLCHHGVVRPAPRKKPGRPAGEDRHRVDSSPSARRVRCPPT
ncbi:hypothetical protein AB0A95_19270 [Micromonospora sp. NPDC049230]|uniref:hypothetical protein n=1 Tax=Micromonospora sp. NPDC049230 TaxID=3155502 RepID=UPI00340C68F6